MNDTDRLMLARCFLFSMKILFAILYAATDGVYSQLHADYKDLADDLKRWSDPDAQPPADAASVKARWG